MCTRRLVLAFAGAALAASCAASARQNAADILARSMENKFSVNVVAIILQRDPSVEGSFQRVKVERDTAGRSRCTILQPLRMQGTTTVDDLNRMRWYLPDQKVIIDQDSPSKEPCQVNDRIRLAKRNYTFKMEASPKIAGRPAVCVVATPRNDELETRRYYIDQSTSYPLRMETYGDSSDVHVVFDTKDVQYPKSLERGLFTLQPIGNVRTERYSRPKKMESANMAARLVGFSPLIPSGFPMGFQVQEVQVSDGQEWKSVVVRLTDGLARATVYQWVPSNVTAKALEDSTTLDHKGVRFMLVSDLGPAVREKLLQAFIAQALSSPAANRPQRLYGLLVAPLGVAGQGVELFLPVWALSGIDSLPGQI